MLIYTDQAWRMAIAVVVIVALTGGLFFLKLRSEAPPEASISGFVEAPDGTPIEGATVLALYNLDEDAREAVPKPVQTQCQAGGEFTLRGLLIRPHYLVAIHPRNCDSTPVMVQLTPRGANGVRLRLVQGGQIEGSVDPSQGPIANRIVTLSKEPDRPWFWRRTRSDASGKFKFEGLDPRDYMIELKPPSYRIEEGTNHVFFVAGAETGPSRRITVRVGQTTTVDFGKN